MFQSSNPALPTAVVAITLNNMVGLTQLRQDAILSAKHLDHLVFMGLFSIRLFSFTKRIPIL